MTKKCLFVSIALLICFGLAESASFIPTEIETGLRYLHEIQKSRSGNASGPSETEDFSSERIVATLKAFENYKTGSSQGGSHSMKNQNVDNISYLIHKIESKYNSGEDMTADLKTFLSYRKPDGGWGGKHTSTNFHTAYAVRVLSKVKYSDQKIIDAALEYLKSRQNKDGGWGFKKGDESTIFMASTVIITFAPFKDIFSYQTAINKGTAYLLSMRNPDGSFSTKKRQ